MFFIKETTKSFKNNQVNVTEHWHKLFGEEEFLWDEYQCLCCGHWFKGEKGLNAHLRPKKGYIPHKI